jgi:hypothetical protein
MKKVICLLIVVALLSMGCTASRTMQGGAIGAGAGAIGSVIAGASGSSAALIIMGGALLGGVIGNIADEQAKRVSLQPENRNKTVVVMENEPSTSTNCTKVTKRYWKNGKMTSEVIEETCDGRKRTNTY